MHKPSWKWSCAVACLIAGAPGCFIQERSHGSDDGGGGGAESTGAGTTSTGADVAIEEACTEFASAVCRRRDTCTDGDATYAAYGDLETCNGREKASCVLRLSAPET